MVGDTVVGPMVISGLGANVLGADVAGVSVVRADVVGDAVERVGAEVGEVVMGDSEGSCVIVV